VDNVVSVDQITHQGRSVGQAFDQSIAVNLAEMIDYRREVEPQTCINET
jgi:hypothetical protein